MNTIPMARDAEHYPAPHTADVHPDEVENFTAAGFVVVDPPAPKLRAKKGASE